MAAMRFPSVSATYRGPSAPKPRPLGPMTSAARSVLSGECDPTTVRISSCGGPILSIDQNDAHDRAAIRAPNKLAFFRKLEALMGIVLPADGMGVFGTGIPSVPARCATTGFLCSSGRSAKRALGLTHLTRLPLAFSPAGRQTG